MGEKKFETPCMQLGLDLTWSVLNFLGSNTYGGRENMKLYRRQIEKLCQRGDERGYQRLKVTNSLFLGGLCSSYFSFKGFDGCHRPEKEQDG